MKPGTQLFTLVILFCLTNFSIDSFAGKDKKFNADKSMKEAERQMKAGNIYEAIEVYKTILENEPEHIEAEYNLANGYFLVRDYINALASFKSVTEKENPKYEKARFYYGLCLKMKGKYAEAKEVFLDFRKKYRGKDAAIIKKRVKVEVQGCDLAIEKLKMPTPVDIKNIGTNINAVYMDFAPAMWGDTALSYSTLHSDSLIIKEKKDKEAYLVKLYRARKVGDTYEKGKMMGPPFNNDKFHVANGTFSPDRTRFYFTQCIDNKSRKKICTIFVSEYLNGSWQEPEKLNEEINDPKYTNTQPCVATIKNKEVLFYASDRPNGEGGLDIWYSMISSKGEYQQSKNLGRKINTMYDEMSPYYNSEDGILYFSSTGHPGLGGFDVFKSKGSGRKWSSVVNMGFPLNSSVDDMYYSLTDNPENGFIVSNRVGSIHLKAETCCDDIYEVKWKMLLRFALTGNVYEAGDTTMTPLEGAVVKVFSIERQSGDPSQILLDTMKNNKNYFTNLDIDQSYSLEASLSGYLSDVVTASTVGLTKSDTLIRNLFLQPIKSEKIYILRNIYYDYDKATLRPESKSSLDSIKTIMNINPTLIVEISSHTDSMGTDEYNIKLSQKRAESVVKYLIRNGIHKNRLIAKGYGERNPIARNTNPDGTDNEEGRQLNRRTEFKIIGQLDGKLEYISTEEDLKTGRHKSKEEREKRKKE